MAGETARSFTFALSNASQQILGPNPNRIAVVIGVTNNQAHSFSIGEPAVNSAGITIPGTAGVPFIVVRRRDIGSAIAQPWYGITTVGTPSISIMEITCGCGGADKWEV